MSQPTTSLPYVSNPLEPGKVQEAQQQAYSPPGYPQQPYTAYVPQPAVYSPQMPSFNPYMASPYAASPQPSQAYYAQPPTQTPSVHVHPMLNTVPTIPREFQKWVVVIKLVSIVQLIFSVWLLIVSRSFFFLLYIPPAVCGIIGATKLNKPLLITYTGLQGFFVCITNNIDHYCCWCYRFWKVITQRRNCFLYFTNAILAFNYDFIFNSCLESN